MLFWCPFFPFIEPNAPPGNLQGYLGNSTSIVVEWGSVPAADQNGIILRYTVTYMALPDGSPLDETVNAPTTQVTLTGLNEYTNYSITVFASTVKGDGNMSVPVVVFTEVDCKYTETEIIVIIISDMFF